MVEGEAHNGSAAHGVPDEHEARQTERLHRLVDALGELFYRVIVRRRAVVGVSRAAVADRDAAVLRAEGGLGERPNATRAAIAVYQDDGVAIAVLEVLQTMGAGLDECVFHQRASI